MKKVLCSIFIFLGVFLISCNKENNDLEKKIFFVNKIDSYKIFLPKIWEKMKAEENNNRFTIKDEKGNIYLMIGTFSKKDENTFSDCKNNIVKDPTSCDWLISNFIGRNKENKGIFWVLQQDGPKDSKKYFDSLGGFENTLKYLKENIKFI